MSQDSFQKPYGKSMYGGSQPPPALPNVNDLDNLVDVDLPPPLAPAETSYAPAPGEGYEESYEQGAAYAEGEPYAEEAYDDVAVPEGGVWETILVEEFQSKDKNGDGFLSMKEITIKELLELDVDHNGFISYDEFLGTFMKKSESNFLKMDLDRDGYLKLAEFARGAATPAMREAYERYAATPEYGLTLDEYRNYLAEQRGQKPSR